MSKHPDRAKCLKYLNDYNTPDHVIGHCKSVAAVACRIGKALNEAGGTIAPDFKDVRFRAYKSAGGRHRYRVSHTSLKKANHKYRPFDIDLVRAAGLLHDMARVEDRHWDVCADFCKKKGLYEEEHIVRVHMQYEFTTDAFHLTEADLVSIGDRLSLEDKYAGLDRRMEYIIRKAEKAGNYSARKVILRKKEETRKLLNQIEKRIGMTLDELMKDIDYDNE
ncbi:MAG: HD domain-containing protein [Firmicutes bacterium]|nr:HD domain-containing protein [Bacillota bacterium]